jgi:ADP-heptose:LPS heptosyltransferase
MHLGSGWEAKRWSILRFSELIKKLLEDNDFEIVIVGGSNDNGIFDELAAGLRDFIPTNKLERMFIQMNILETAELIRRSAVFIGSDSGPLHLAGAVNVPTVGLFGPTNPDFSNPIGERHNVIYRKLNCSASYHNQYCNRNAGKNCTTLECMKDISADEVFDSVAMLLRKYHHIDAISGSF